MAAAAVWAAGGGLRPTATGPHGPGSSRVQGMGLHVCDMRGLAPAAAQGSCTQRYNIFPDSMLEGRQYKPARGFFIPDGAQVGLDRPYCAKIVLGEHMWTAMCGGDSDVQTFWSCVAPTQGAICVTCRPEYASVRLLKVKVEITLRDAGDLPWVLGLLLTMVQEVRPYFHAGSTSA